MLPLLGEKLRHSQSSRSCTNTLFLLHRVEIELIFRSVGSGFWDTGWFSILPYLGVKIGHYQKFQKLYILPCTNPIFLTTYHSGIFLTYFSCFQTQVQFFQRCTRHTLRQVHRITPKWPWTLTGQRYPICIQTHSLSPEFHAISLYFKPFRVTGHFETSALNDPKMTLNTSRLKVPHIHIKTTPDSQVSIRFAV